uniref:Cyclic nucleotide-gated cation channel beta-3-like n=1 Tax=Mastacembelus armatus TaxID=205130 RepID=A0A7N8Y6W4_9TELE
LPRENATALIFRSWWISFTSVDMFSRHLLLSNSLVSIFCLFSEEAAPPPPSVVYSHYTDDILRGLIKRLRERTEMLREKAIDPYATSPEITPPVKHIKYFNLCGFLSSDRRYVAWLTVVALAYNYNIWFCSARLAFPYHNQAVNPYWIVFDILSDTVNVIDIMVWQPRLQFVKAGDIIVSPNLFWSMTKMHYRKSQRFKTDIFSILPFDLLCLHFEFSSMYRLNRFIRIESFFEFSDRLESILAKAYIWRVARTTGYLLFMLHLNACAFYVASVYQGLATTTWVYDGKGTAYLRCYYFAVRSLINIGGLPEPITTFEITFQMTNFFIGVFVFSSLIGQMRDVIGAATAGETYFRASMDGCVAYMHTYTIPRLVQNRVRTWYNYTWAAQGMLDESELLDKMPLVMRTAIAVDINLATFQKIALFQGCDQQMLVDMLLRLKSIVYLPGDFVVKKVSMFLRVKDTPSFC